LEAQWYFLRPLHSEIPSLADLLEVSPENLQHLSVKGGLEKLGRADKSFCFLASQFESFRATYMMEENCEVRQCKIKGMKPKEWSVGLGSQYTMGIQVTLVSRVGHPGFKAFEQSNNKTSRKRFRNVPPIGTKQSYLKKKRPIKII
jgi:hypothetical protein